MLEWFKTDFGTGVLFVCAVVWLAAVGCVVWRSIKITRRYWVKLMTSRFVTRLRHYRLVVEQWYESRVRLPLRLFIRQKVKLPWQAFCARVREEIICFKNAAAKKLVALPWGYVIIGTIIMGFTLFPLISSGVSRDTIFGVICAGEILGVIISLLLADDFKVRGLKKALAYGVGTIALSAWGCLFLFSALIAMASD